MKTLLWIAGGLQIVIAAANFPAKRIMGFRTELAKVAPLVRQIVQVQYAYTVSLLVFFGAVTVLLADGGRLALATSAMLALFWGGRLVVQLFYYDPDFRRRHRAADLFFTLSFVYLAAVFAAATAGALR